MIFKSDLKNSIHNIKVNILKITTKAGSGHPTSSLSMVEFCTLLFYNNYLKVNFNDHHSLLSDKFILSKGHATPYYYSLLAEMGVIAFDELYTYRSLKSRLEGHSTFRFKESFATTGSLGQGLGIGVGTCLYSRLNNYNTRTLVVCGDSELAEGSNWEAVQLASYQNLGNLFLLVDFNKLGQNGSTIYKNSHQLLKLFEAYNWDCYEIINGHDLEEISNCYSKAFKINKKKPTAIIVNTIKGNGISFLENMPNWHGKTLDEDQLKLALKELKILDK
jgi:transketolase